MESEQTLPPDVYLEVMSQSGKTSTFPVDKKTVTLGRDPSCDITLEDPYVSRKHCQIVFRGDHFTVMDLGSTNKTVIRGKDYIQRNLKHDSVIEIGKTEVRFVWEDMQGWKASHSEAGPEPAGADATGAQEGAAGKWPSSQ